MLLRIAVAVGLAFIYVPLLVIAVYAFNSSKILAWPPPGFTFHWFSVAFENESVKEAFLTSIEAGVVATAIALLLGTLAALAVVRHRFFGRETISFLVVLPIVNVVAVLVVLISIIPVYLAHRLTREEGGVAAARGGRGKGGGVETEATAVP